MQVCCNSHSHERMLKSGDLTQLEWVDLCANELMVHGVEFAASHFPRFDRDYLAQLKKLCADRCLTVASFDHDVAFDAADADEHADLVERHIEAASALGAPLMRLVSRGATGSPAVAWRELIRGLKRACVHAKERNVTLALQPRDGTLVTTPEDAKRVMKECDSAWLRLGLSAVSLAQARDEWSDALQDTTIAIAPMSRLDTFGADEDVDYITVLGMLREHRFRGFISLLYGGEEDERPAVARAVLWLRGMLAKDALKMAATETVS